MADIRGIAQAYLQAMQAAPTPHPKWKIVSVSIEPGSIDPDFPEDGPGKPSVVAWYAHPSDAELRRVPRAVANKVRDARAAVTDSFAAKVGWSHYFTIAPVGSKRP